MASGVEITIEVPEDQFEAVRSAVSAGDYASTNAVVVEALRDWHDRRLAERADAQRLREEWRDGLASGPFAPLDMNDVKSRGRKMLARRGGGSA